MGLRTARVDTKQCSLSLSFPDEFLCSDITLLEGDDSVFDFEGADTAVAVKPLLSRQLFCYLGIEDSHKFAYWIILDEGRELGIGHNPIECPIDVFRDLAMDFQIEDFSFHSTWLHEPGKLRAIWKIFLGLLRKNGHFDCYLKGNRERRSCVAKRIIKFDPVDTSKQ